MWFWYALGSALVGAVVTVLSKIALKKVSASLLTWSLFALPLPFLAFLSLSSRPQNIRPAFLTGTFLSAVVFVFSKTLSNHSIKNNHLSKVMPLNNLGALFTYVFGLIIISETVKPLSLLGIFVTVFGTYLLNAETAREGLLQPLKILVKDRGSLIFILAVVLSSLSGVFDKIGLKGVDPENPALALLSESFFMTVFLTFYLIRTEKGWVGELKKSFGSLLLISLIYTLSSYLIFSGFLGGPVALVSTVKRLQVFFILLLGYLFLKDKPPKHAWLATAVMIAGVLLIKLA